MATDYVRGYYLFNVWSRGYRGSQLRHHFVWRLGYVFLCTLSSVYIFSTRWRHSKWQMGTKITHSKHTAHTIVSWPNPKQRQISHISALVMIMIWIFTHGTNLFGHTTQHNDGVMCQQADTTLVTECILLHIINWAERALIKTNVFPVRY